MILQPILWHHNLGRSVAAMLLHANSVPDDLGYAHGRGCTQSPPAGFPQRWYRLAPAMAITGRGLKLAPARPQNHAATLLRSFEFHVHLCLH